MPKQSGFVSQLFLIVVFLTLVALSVGSAIYFKDNIMKVLFPPGPVAPVEVTVDKSQFAQGEVLVSFVAGTTYEEALTIFSKISPIEINYIGSKTLSPQTSLEVIDIFKLTVERGSEQETVNTLVGFPKVATASLNYIDHTTQ